MTDIMSKQQRSKLMSRIRGRDTGIEKLLMLELKKQKVSRFKYQLKMTGNPDFVFPDHKIAVFCDGDFWHGYNFESRKPKLRKYWRNKISSNMKRDKDITRHLRKNGWKVIRIWEHQIRKNPASCVNKIQKFLVS